MALQIHPPAGETIDQLREAIATALPGAEIEVHGSGGHWELRVVSEAFEGKNRLGKQRLVLSAIKHLMAGDAAPVHAVDKLETLTPGESGSGA